MHFSTYASGCSDSPVPPHSVSDSTSCGETPEPRFVPFLTCSHPVLCPPTYIGSKFFTTRVLERNPLCLHLASRPRLCCFGKGAPHIWNSRRNAILLFENCATSYYVICRCCISGTPRYYPTLTTVQALFNWVVTPHSSPGYCMHNL